LMPEEMRTEMVARNRIVGSMRPNGCSPKYARITQT
jgi:hypothetical protein